MQPFYAKYMRISGLDIKKFREENDLSQTDLAKLMGISYKTILNYENGKAIPEPRLEILDRIFREYKKEDIKSQILDSSTTVNETQFQYQRNGPTPYFTKVEPFIKEQLIKVPLVEINARAGFIENLENYTEYITDFTYILPERGERYENAIAIVVDGDSMEPQLQRGDKVLAILEEKGDWTILNPGVYAIVYRNSFSIKRIKRNTLGINGRLELHSDNSDLHGVIDVGMDEIRTVWRVLRILARRVY